MKPEAELRRSIARARAWMVFIVLEIIALAWLIYSLLLQSRAG